MRVFVGRDPDTGKRQFVSKSFSRKGDAEKEARRLERARDTGTLTAPSRETVGKYLRRWLRDVMQGKVRRRTWADYSSILSRYVEQPPAGAPAIGALRMDRLRPEAIQSLYGWLLEERDLSPSTIRRLHAVLRQGLQYATRTGAVARNAADLVVLPRQSKREVHAMSEEEAARFLEAASGDRHSALWHLLLTAGLRPSEALALTWPDVDLERGRVRVQRTLVRRGKRHEEDASWRLVEPKTNRGRRVVPVPAYLAAELRRLRARQAEEKLLLGGEYEDHGFVFASEFGRPLHLRNLGARRFRRIMQKAELGQLGPEPPKPARGPRPKRTFRPAYRLYDLRHTCATLLLRSGENPKVVSERLGHSSVAFTMDVYAAYMPDMQEAAAEKFEAMFSGTLS